MNSTKIWKHGSYFPVEEPDAIAVFDDEYDNGINHCDTIYHKVGDKFSPCRSINRLNRDHWRNVLLAWAEQAPLLDMRNNREVPLP